MLSPGTAKLEYFLFILLEKIFGQTNSFSSPEPYVCEHPKTKISLFLLNSSDLYPCLLKL
jgi:hypothetical protein